MDKAKIDMTCGFCDKPMKGNHCECQEKPIPKKTENPYNTQIGGDHYTKTYPYCQPLEFFSKNKIPFTIANVCKYVLRYKQKNGIQDLKKAKHYLEVIAWDEYGEVL